MATSTQPEVESFASGDLEVRIVWDADPLSPRLGDTVGTIAAKEGNWSDDGAVSAKSENEFYCNLCRKAGLPVEEKQLENRAEWCKDEARSRYIILPVYVHKHSGIAMSTSSFDDSWDSGQAGFIYVSRDEAEELSPTDKNTEEWATQVLSDEVEVFGRYLDGDVYGFVIENEDGEVVDSCYGFYDLEYCKKRATAIAQDQ